MKPTQTTTMKIQQTHKNLANLSFVFLFCLVSSISQVFSQRVGDAGVKFDNSKMDSNYPQMSEWIKAGVEGGIPALSSSKIKKTIGPTNSDGLMSAINEVSRNGGGQLRLRNGNYTINKPVIVKNNVRIVGENRNGVVLTINMTGNKDDGKQGVFFKGAKRSSLERLTIKGNQSGRPDPFRLENVKPNYFVSGVSFSSGAKNCWLDKVTILDTGTSPINVWKSNHLTFRDLDVNGVWNKGGGGSGYFALMGGYALVYNCTIKNLRHFAIQREGAFYNVVYKNNITQDVNFHNADAGNNLIEQNNITIQSGFDFQYHAVMGPWASFHKISDTDNYVYKNSCIERNNDNRRSFSDNNTVYLGPRRKEDRSRIPEYPFDKTNRTPKGGTFYPVRAGNDGGNPPLPPTGGSSLVHMKKRNASGFAIDGRNGGANGQNVHLWAQNRNNNNQQWEEIDRGNGFYSYKKKGTNFCLDGGNGGANGQNVYLWTCSDNNQNQHWRKVNVGGNNYRLEKRNAPKYSIDGRGGGANRQNIYLWTSNNNNQNQHWQFTSINNRSSNLDAIADGKIVMFPNPASDQLAIMGLTNDTNYNVHIYNMQGALSLTKEISPKNETSTTIDISNLAIGSYVVKILTNNNVFPAELLMITR